MTKTKSDLGAWASDIDTEATRALIAELQTEGKPWDKLESSEKKYVTSYRRICPKRPEWQNPYQIVPVHYLGPQNRMVVCLKESGLGECPGCQLRWQLEEGGDKQAAAGLRSSVRTFLNVVHINQDGTLAEAKVFLLGLNQLQFLGKRGVEYDPDEEGELPLFYFFEKYGDLSHVETGRDLEIKAKLEPFKRPDGGEGTQLRVKFSVAEPSPFPGSGDLLEEGLNNLQEVAAILEGAEMMALIEGRATGAMVLGTGTPGSSPAQVAAPAAAPANRFGGAEEEEETIVPEETTEPAEEPATEGEEEPKSNPRAAQAPPKTDPTAAIARLRKSQGQ